MNPTLALLRREWLQHRFGWLLMATLPTALMLLLLLVPSGNFSFSTDGDLTDHSKASIAALAGLLVPSALHLAIYWAAAMIFMAGLPRRDHADRSVAFWLSMPIGHAQALAVPLLVHLLVVPLAALGVGMLSGAVVSAVLLGRLAVPVDWANLPWGALYAGQLALVVRLALGALLAVLWLSPLVLAIVALGAWFGKWGLVIGAVGLGLGSAAMDKLFDQPWLWNLLVGLADRASRSVLNASGQKNINVGQSETVENVLRLLPQWVAGDALDALGLLASPWLVGALAASACLFGLLVQWRRQGALAG